MMRMNLSIPITFLGLIINYIIISIANPFELGILGIILFFVIFFSTWGMGFIPACIYFNKNDIYDAGQYWIFENGKIKTIKTNLGRGTEKIGRLIIPILIFAPVIFIFMRTASMLLLVVFIIILGGLLFGKALSNSVRTQN